MTTKNTGMVIPSALEVHLIKLTYFNQKIKTSTKQWSSTRTNKGQTKREAHTQTSNHSTELWNPRKLVLPVVHLSCVKSARILPTLFRQI